MPFKDDEQRREHLKIWKENNPDKMQQYYIKQQLKPQKELSEKRKEEIKEYQKWYQKRYREQKKLEPKPILTLEEKKQKRLANKRYCMKYKAKVLKQKTDK